LRESANFLGGGDCRACYGLHEGECKLDELSYTLQVQGGTAKDDRMTELSTATLPATILIRRHCSYPAEVFQLKCFSTLHPLWVIPQANMASVCRSETVANAESYVITESEAINSTTGGHFAKRAHVCTLYHAFYDIIRHHYTYVQSGLSRVSAARPCT
jgi:hypothetical protein